VAQVHRDGPLPFSTVMREALYGPEGFYTKGGGAGRRRDFVTSPEVGSLFGAVMANALDSWWLACDSPDPFIVAECGAGPGTLAVSILAAKPVCAPALRYLMIDSSPAMRDIAHSRKLPLVESWEVLAGFAETSADDDEAIEGFDDRVPSPRQGPLVASLSALPDSSVHVVFANELLDNLPFDIAVRTVDGWAEVRVGLAAEKSVAESVGEAGSMVAEVGHLAGNRDVVLGTGTDQAKVASNPLASPMGLGVKAEFVEYLVPATDEMIEFLDAYGVSVPVGSEIPVAREAVRWVREAVASLADGGRVVCIDYAAATEELALRPDRGWLRTYRGQTNAGDPLSALGSCDITTDVPWDKLPKALICTQSEFLGAHGIDELVVAAQAYWDEHGVSGGLAALKARSRISEAQTLTEPGGLGGFLVLEWRR
jgi:SAM-dependent MidA family methyltransferase